MHEPYMEWRERKRREEIRAKQAAPCVGLRLKHQFRERKTRGKPHDDSRCFWCGRTYGEIKSLRAKQKKAKREVKT